MKNIFISYSRQNHAVTEELVSALKTLGYKLWYDQKLSGGQRWWDSILDRIRSCDIFVLVIDRAALRSTACRVEYSYASDLGKPIIPVLVAQDGSEKVLPPKLQTIQYIDYREQDHTAALRLAGALSRLPPTKPLPNPLPVSPAMPVSITERVNNVIEASSNLDLDQQRTLVHDLKKVISDPEAIDEADVARGLLEKLKRRDDLFASIDREINAALASLKSPHTKASFVETPPPQPSVQERSLGFRLFLVLISIVFFGVAGFLTLTIDSGGRPPSDGAFVGALIIWGIGLIVSWKIFRKRSSG